MSKFKKRKISLLAETNEDVSSEKTALNSEEMISAIKKSKQQAKVPSCKVGLPKGWRRVTFIMRDDHYEKLQEMSYLERITMKDILEKVFDRLFEKQTKSLRKETAKSD